MGGIKLPTVDRYIAGFRAGAHRASPRSRHLNSYAGTFLDPQRCRSVATAQVAKGAGVVFPVAGACGLGALRLAKAKRVWGIGVDGDQSDLGSHVLTSALKRMDLAVYRTVELLVSGELKTGGDTLLGVREGALGLGRMSPRLPPELRRRAERILRQVGAGSIVGIPATV